MTRQIVIESQPTFRKQPLLQHDGSSRKTRFGEVAGGTTAECAAVCCCCPCGLMNLLVLAVYILPAGMCRKAIKKMRKRKKTLKKLLALQRKGQCRCVYDETDRQIHPVMNFSDNEDDGIDVRLTQEEVLELEKEMWDKFYSAGFWRSSSQRE